MWQSSLDPNDSLYCKVTLGRTPPDARMREPPVRAYDLSASAVDDEAVPKTKRAEGPDEAQACRGLHAASRGHLLHERPTRPTLGMSRGVRCCASSDNSALTQVVVSSCYHRRRFCSRGRVRRVASVACCMLDVACWVLHVTCWVLHGVRWMLGVACCNGGLHGVC